MFASSSSTRHPLHLACLCHCPSTIASTVLNAYPEAAAIPDTEEQQYPLHIAALHGANGTLLQRLYNCYPDAIKARTKTHGWLPLHLACHKDATPGAVRVLLEYYPDAAKVSWSSSLYSSLTIQLTVWTYTSVVNILDWRQGVWFSSIAYCISQRMWRGNSQVIVRGLSWGIGKEKLDWRYPDGQWSWTCKYQRTNLFCSNQM